LSTDPSADLTSETTKTLFGQPPEASHPIYPVNGGDGGKAVGGERPRVVGPVSSWLSQAPLIPQLTYSDALLAQQVVESLAERSCVPFRVLSPRFPQGKHHLLLTSNCTSFAVLLFPANAPLVFSL